MKSIILLIPLVIYIRCQDHDIPKFKRGPVEVLDETALSNPNSFDYDFSDDLNKPADKQDLYDQFIDQLPMFHLFKLGKDNGVTQVPIVTRRWDTWFTPSTISTKEQEFTFYKSTTPMPTEQTTTARPSTTTRRFTRPTISTTTFRPRTTMVPRQPPSVFRASTTTTSQPPFNRGPIWRKGMVIYDTTTTVRPTTPQRWTRRQFHQTTTTTMAPTTTTRASIGGRWITGPRNPPRFENNWRKPIQHLQETLARPTSHVPVDPISRSLPKPVIIQNPHGHQYRGPTYNCRVLNPFTDGEPSAEHDENCKMLYPGLSLDGSCRCYYKVAGRDEHGCATGFVYACRDVNRHSVSV